MTHEKSIQVSDDLIAGRAIADCPDMRELVTKVKKGELPKEDLIDVVDISLDEQEKMEKLKKYIL
jgi:hypothetical protein